MKLGITTLNIMKIKISFKILHLLHSAYVNISYKCYTSYFSKIFLHVVVVYSWHLFSKKKLKHANILKNKTRSWRRFVWSCTAS